MHSEKLRLCAACYTQDTLRALPSCKVIHLQPHLLFEDLRQAVAEHCEDLLPLQQGHGVIKHALHHRADHLGGGRAGGSGREWRKCMGWDECMRGEHAFDHGAGGKGAI